ncbi:hypothetical protein EBR66_08810, partial [bacterium]|nr:hypothetical protein [bacterium]
NLALPSLTSTLLKTNSQGQLVAAVAGTDYLAPSSTFGKAWEIVSNIFGQSALAPTTTQNILVNGIGTSTIAGGLETWRQIGAPYFNATSTSATTTLAGQLTVGSNAFNVLSNGNVGVGTAVPGYKLEVNGTAKIVNTFTLGTVASCSGSQALQTDASGNVLCGSISTGGASSGGGWTTNNTGRVSLSTTTDQVVVGASTTPYAKFGILSGSTATTTLAILPAPSQVANIIDIYNTAGNLDTVFNSSGFLGVGTTSPGSRLSVAGNIYANGNITGANVIATGTLAVSGQSILGYASSTGISTGYASSTSAFFGNLSIANLSGFLKATAGSVSTALISLTSDVT